MQEQIKKTIEVLEKGGIILYPTDTIWGIGCDATNKNAIEKIYNLKKRPKDNSMLILLSNIVQLSQYVEIIPDIAYQLIECSVEPITIIYPNAKNLPFEIINKDNSIGIRITKDAFCQNLINNFKKPLISTSANISGEKTPLNFQSISDEIKQNVDYIVDLETNSIGTGKASSIIKIEINGEFKIIRY